MAEGSDGTGGDGTERTAGDVVERRTPDEAFELLGNDTRLGILRALFEAEDPLTFSELRDVTGTGDSGQFNYHLGQLRDSFVRKTDDGYELSAAGTHVVGAILAGTYTKSIEADPVEVDSTCQHCGDTLVGRFEAEGVRVACGGCDRTVLSLVIPPGAFEEYPREEWPLVAERWTRREFETVDDGFCGVCHGSVASHVETDPTEVFDVFEAAVHYVCERCGQDTYANVESSVLFHPAVVTFHYERGIDVRETPIWDLDWAVGADAAVVSEDPLRIDVPVELEGDRLVLTLDEEGTVVEERLEEGRG